jgi:hypothetical protein
MSVQIEQRALARQAAFAKQAAGGLICDDPDFEPIAGIGLEQFAAVSRGVAAFGHDLAKLAHVIASAGIPAQQWESAAAGWQERIRGNHAVARRFNQFYKEAWA